ncbi:hypothetical protein CEXT_590571 [Caerostris extrusa]|uniref:Calcineurin-like phosphoesterase domain-containing protein n=1 Tax=Caerostris extrusa TaxID=172846 RepID=A0AAV4X1U3_CAEEX|nr:hypothetical protein CEXT_590571 [Caerostris extrusa]
MGLLLICIESRIYINTIITRENFFNLLSFNNSKWEGPFYFIQGADTQFGMISTFERDSDTGWEEEIRLTKKAIQLINTMTPKPKFFIVCGDLIHSFPGGKRPFGSRK